MNLSQRYAQLRAEIPAHVTIVAVTKFHPAQTAIEAIAAGVTDIGENYLQEARAKFAQLPAVRKHFIGHVQTNKAAAIAQTFDMVQSVDRVEAARALAGAAQRLGKRLPVLLQANISPGDRFGCSPDDVPALAQCIRDLEALRLDGLMAIGPITPDRALLRRAFELAAALHAQVGGPTLSLGMSGDWREALEAGTTMLRLGTSLFGPRAAPAASKGT